MEAVLEGYLYAYRPPASTTEIQESAAADADLTLEDQSLLVAALLGVLEGLTEFIPVSSTGHILLAGHFLGFHSTGKAFEVLIQLGAILAILSVYAGRLLTLARRLPDRPADPALRRRGAARLPAGGGARGGAARHHQDRALRDAGAGRDHADPRRRRAALGGPAAGAAALSRRDGLSAAGRLRHRALPVPGAGPRRLALRRRPSSARCCSGPTSARRRSSPSSCRCRRWPGPSPTTSSRTATS